MQNQEDDLEKYVLDLIGLFGVSLEAVAEQFGCSVIELREHLARKDWPIGTLEIRFAVHDAYYEKLDREEGIPTWPELLRKYKPKCLKQKAPVRPGTKGLPTMNKGQKI
jgi:transposase